VAGQAAPGARLGNEGGIDRAMADQTLYHPLPMLACLPQFELLSVAVRALLGVGDFGVNGWRLSFMRAPLLALSKSVRTIQET